MNIHCAHDEVYPLAKLIPHPRNPNTHTDEQIDLLAKIMTAQGIRNPIKISRLSGFITAGHGRLMAARKNNWLDFPVDIQDYENEAMEYADLVADNAIAELSKQDYSKINQDILDLGPDLEIELLGIPGFEVEPLDRLDPQTDEDEVPEPPKEAKTKPGDIYTLGKHRLMCGDSTNFGDFEKVTHSQQMDMVLTDPPYNINFKPQRGTHDVIKNDNMGDLEFVGFLASMFTNCKTVMKKDSYLVSFMGWSTIKQFNESLDGIFEIKSMPIWVKNNFGIGYYTRPKYEPMYLCLNGEPTKPISPPADVFEFQKVYKTTHSCEKPIELLENLLSHFSTGPNTLDPFGGSGSTLIACEKTNRTCFMMELDPVYCDVIVKRWEDYTGQKAVLTNG